MKEVLDTRFLVAHFAPEDETMRRKASEKMRTLRRSGNAVLPTLVLAEFFNQVCQRAGAAVAEATCAALLHSGMDVVPLSAETAQSAGRLRCSHRRVPLGDCIIAAEARIQHGRVITDDPHFREFPDVKVAWI